jgi:AAA+ ATPase superfamily predicted ATPase
MSNIKKPVELVDRDKEWDFLNAVWNSPRAELLFVVGRRRVGKSFLLTRHASLAAGIYYQATRRTEAEQLARLSRVVGERFSDAALLQGVSFPNWEALLAYLTARAGDEAFLVVLDEFPYLSDSAPALPSILQSWWDQTGQRTRIKLVLSGSHITAMRRLEAADQPLYGRRTRRLVLVPFSAHEVGAFVPSYGAEERLLTYGVIGGLPGHLSLLDPVASLSQNAADLLFEPSGRLADDAQHMLDALLDDASVHYSIIEAIATGDSTWKGITNRVGRTGGSLLRPMTWLTDMRIVARAVPISERAPQKSKRALYRITDPYVAFWHRFISPLVAVGSLGLVDPTALWNTNVVPRLDDYMGSVFESACRQALHAGKLAIPFTPVRIGEWWDSGSTEQIDVVALGVDGELLVGECKWGTVTGADVATLERRAKLLAVELGGVRQIHAAVFSGHSRFDAEVLSAAKAGRVLTFGADDIS